MSQFDISAMMYFQTQLLKRKKKGSSFLLIHSVRSERSMKTVPNEPEVQPNDIYRRKLKNELGLKLVQSKPNSQGTKKFAKLQALRNNSSDILRHSRKMILTWEKTFWKLIAVQWIPAESYIIRNTLFFIFK